MINRVQVLGVGKAYRTYRNKWGRAAEWLGAPRQHELHWVLRDVAFEMGPGESVGIIGVNGAGKSTLLKIIAGVTRPTTGVVHRSGRLAALLELGMGFHPDFSGRQNVFMSGQVQGLSAEEVARHMGEIEAFADIGEYIDEPVRTYSSGMQVRLAFSVATAVRPEILIVDEALAVGDIFFQQKCFERLHAFREQGTTLLFVSHSIGSILQLCDRAILLRDGVVAIDGSPREATDLYQAGNLLKLDKRPEDVSVAPAGPTDAGSTELAAGSLTSLSVTFSAARLLDASGEQTTALPADSPAKLQLEYAIHRDLEDPHVGFKVRDKFGTVLFETNTYCMRESIGPCAAGTRLVVTFEFRVLLAPGEYTVTAGFANRGFAEGSFEEALSYLHGVLAFSVVRMSTSITWLGLINLEPRVGLEKRVAAG
jgi:lipopolysaccharide transport system ATP-binding protein